MTIFQKVKKNSKVYESVIIQLKNKISAGELLPGDYLPPERELAEMMGVSRSSVREALKVLEFMGLIESRTKGGTNIAHLNSEFLIDKLNALDVLSNDRILLDLLELRETLEPRIIELAVERGSEEELAELEKNMEDLRSNLDEESNTKADALFHLNIAKASHNIFYIQLIETLLAMLKEIRIKTINLSRQREKILDEHLNIANCLKNRDKSGARTAMETHLRNIKSIVERNIPK